MKSKSITSKTHSYSSDKPIISKKQDILGRAKFAEHLANDLNTWDGKDSLVVALYGTWGSGKTSVKNMVLEANQRKRSLNLPIIEFNPWRLSGTGSIRSAFFSELNIALRGEGPKKDVKKRAKKLNAYAKSLSLLGSTIELAGKAMPYLGAPSGPVVEAVGKGNRVRPPGY